MNSDGTQQLPVDIPAIVEPNYERKMDTAEIAVNITRLRNFLSFSQHEWWQQFLDDPSGSSGGHQPWYLDVLLPQVANIQVDIIPEREFVSPLSISMEKERNIPKVITGTKRHVKASNATMSRGQMTPTKKQKVDAKVGYMVACVQEDELTIGKVSHVGNTTVHMTVYYGTLAGEWVPALDAQGSQYDIVLKKSDIENENIFFLTKSARLPSVIKEKLRKYF